ncbi:MAG TPA: choice-of-anchor tandem repeat GloVer-containing protein [Ohtaekwangia sp.]|nr:choice-of-anchor tandem repeat GloVer-containing protein [Ohtaekwangia sp.]
MKKKIYPLHVALTLLLSFSICTLSHAQDRLWGLTTNENGGSVYHVNKDGSDLTPSIALGYDYPAGVDPQYLTQANDGSLYGINGRGSENADKSILYRISSDGVTKIFNFPYPVTETAGLVESSHGYLYGVGKTPGGNNRILFRFRPDGSGYQSKTISVYAFNARGGLMCTEAGTIVGMSESGGDNGNGFIYKVNPDFSGIQIIFHFDKPGGKRPFGKLTEGPDGFLYGLTNSGGLYNYGAIFKISQDGQSYTKLHDFNLTQGAFPTDGLVIKNGVAYGTTLKGGVDKKGVVFKIGLDGSDYTILHSFSGADGEFPFGNLVIDQNNTIYGIAKGGEFNEGVLYAIHADGSQFVKLINFHHENPTGNLIAVTYNSVPAVGLSFPAHQETGAPIHGKYRCNRVSSALNYTLQLSEHADFRDTVATLNGLVNEFDLASQSLKFSTQYHARVRSSVWPAYGSVTSFTTRSETDYAFISKPSNGATGQATMNLKVTVNQVPGATRYTIQLSKTPDFSGEILSDTSKTDGQRTMTFSHLDYATVYYARGKSNVSESFGRVSSFTTQAETFITITSPVNGATGLDQSLFTVSCSSMNAAEAYTIELSATPDFAGPNILRSSLTKGQRIFNFKNLNPATTYYLRAKCELSTQFGPVSALTTRDPISAKRIWGVTTRGGAADLGTIFSFSLDSGKFTKHRDYEHPDQYGSLSGSLIQTPTGFAGLSISHGTGGGEVFTLDKDGYTLLETYGPHEGSVMMGSDNYIYVVDDWINYFRGGIYKIYADGDSVNALDRIIFRFRSDWHGSNPTAQLLEQPDGYLYGTASNRGSLNKGTLFRLKMDGSGHEVIHTFNGTQGAHPDASLIMGADDYLYGVTPFGGSYDKGVLFKIQPDGTDFAVLYEFNSAQGTNPMSNLLWYNGKLYGTASAGGAYDNGVVFSINPDGTGYTKLLECDGVASANPYGGLTPDENGVLYGTTTAGGDHNLGVIFSLNPDGSSYEKLFSFSQETGGSPNGNLLLLDDTFVTPAPSLFTDAHTNTLASDVLVYPNPFTNYFTARIKDQNEHAVRLTIRDLSGAVVMEANANSDTQLGDQLKRGIYVLTVHRGSVITTHRLIKN